MIWAIILIAPWLVICALHLFVRNPQIESATFWDILFPALSALYTGFSVIVAYRHLIEEKDSFIRQTKISVFSEIMNSLANDYKYQESLEYIISGSYDKDIDTVQKVLNVDKKEEISLDDFWKILYKNLRSEGTTLSTEKKTELSKAYEKIKYFCRKMDYIGVIADDEYASTLIIEHYGDTIKKTYEIVGNLIEKDLMSSKSEGQYKHYTSLYRIAKANEKNRQ